MSQRRTIHETHELHEQAESNFRFDTFIPVGIRVLCAILINDASSNNIAVGRLNDDLDITFVICQPANPSH